MDFALSEEQTAIFDMARAFGQDRIAPFARQWEAEGTIPKELWPEIAALGFGGLYVSEDAGGAGLSRLDAMLVFEALSMACPSVAAFLSIHNMCAAMIDRYGSNDLKGRVMPDVIAMQTVLSYCLTEPGAGSDAANLKTRAEPTSTGFRLNGTKAFISGGGYSDAYLVMARTGEDGPKGISALLVEDGTEGLSFGGLEDKMGWRSQPTRQVQFDNCDILSENTLGEVGQGFTYAMSGLDGGRLNIAACSLGAAQVAMDQTRAYMAERKAFGQSIDQFQGLQFRLADMEIELQAARVFLRQAAWKLDSGAPDATTHCAMAKKFVTEAGSRIVNGCLQMHGGYGYLADYGIEKLLRDLRVHEILEGTNEIMRLIVARDIVSRP
ncbi:acyl-CoA dehydrogenase family protein [Roseovarius sp. LXJ103]|uniref:acyl-CoA dehydrogenase family protein n=1 Tax=Roseovarius carneus TaxID=2853164 RepID=UPI000D61D183|nr:acyl-CoA dehydrogenase family protein [Roseovarius carneus]MBZ8119039.1 acyl-CoA dehydrogenase family protein [Roseovarius carneus]PWE35312.1 acyl-CoA dehydrogenase [Pelagicola sp. LXJ1103]